MSILSDLTIAAHIREGKLVPNGAPERVDQNSYKFRAGIAYKAGCLDSPTDFSASEGAEFLIQPGEMVWVRTLETVDLPSDLAGFWVQTNTLSRKGLMLVNISMVEPGYAGPLACLFVNFGKRVIPIQSDTTIAKMMFLQLDRAVGRPYTDRPNVAEYDHALRELAIDQPTSFLQVAELAANIRDARETAIRDVKVEADMAKAQMKADMSQVRADEVLGFREDALKSVRRSMSWAAGAVVLLTIVTVGAAWIQSRFMNPNMEKVARSEAESVLSERVSVPGSISPHDQVIIQRLDVLDRRIGSLEKRPPAEVR